jgi:uncharacterized protein (DUF1778 family)
MGRIQRSTAGARASGRESHRSAGARETRTISARVDFPTFELIDQAARLRGIDRQSVIVAGAVREAQRILEVAATSIAAYRRRRAKQSKRKGVS